VILKEILTNVAKHANCKNARAQLSFKEFVEIMVIDDGIGFDVEKRHHGNGFHIIRSRCKNLSANLSIASKMGGGTTIKVIFST
jgi:signal transduction histidine kinase